METLRQLIGSDADTILWWQMVCRGVLIFFFTLFLVRIGGRRIFGMSTSFDIVLGVILGSLMSRALTANARLGPALAAATALVLLHRVLAEISQRNVLLANLFKGIEVRLVENGKIDHSALKRNQLTEHDLQEALRLNGGVLSVDEVQSAYLERSGEVSVVPCCRNQQS